MPIRLPPATARSVSALSLRPFGSFRFYPLQGNLPAIATAGERLDVLRRLSRVAERLPQPLDGGIDAVIELYHRVVRPELLANLFPQHHIAGLFQQQRQDLYGLLRQPSIQSCFPKFACPEIQLKGSKANEMGKRSRIHGISRSEFITVQKLFRSSSSPSGMTFLLNPNVSTQ